MTHDAPRIVAPVSSVQDARAALAAGADEIYCGAMFDDWVDVFGEADFLTRRQGRPAHVRHPRELAEIAALGLETGCLTTLVLNARYSAGQQHLVLDLASRWEDVGGGAIMVSDLMLLVALEQRRSKLKRHLSLLAGAYNSMTVAFFAELGATRVVLPRDLTLAEMRSLIAGGPAMAYEALVMHQRCQFMDDLCGFYHGVRYPDEAPIILDPVAPDENGMPVLWSHDPAYEGHGCQLAWRTDADVVRPLFRNDFVAPHCAGCLLNDLWTAGVHSFKIAGRGWPSDMIVRSIRFLADAWAVCRDAEAGPARVRDLYRRMFGAACEGQRCYYRHEARERWGNS